DQFSTGWAFVRLNISAIRSSLGLTLNDLEGSSTSIASSRSLLINLSVQFLTGYFCLLTLMSFCILFNLLLLSAFRSRQTVNDLVNRSRISESRHMLKIFMSQLSFCLNFSSMMPFRCRK